MELDEHSDKPRYQEHLRLCFPAYLKAGLTIRVPGRKRVTVASDFAMRALHYQLEIGGPDPRWFTDAMKRRKTKSKEETVNPRVRTKLLRLSNAGTCRSRY